MCGIVGVLNNHIDQQLFGQMVDALHHRGPDFSNTFFTETLALGHTRLAIQDLSAAANQPMISEDNNYSIIFNGEIYNHLELREKIDYDFKTHCDTETLLQGYIQYGEAFLPQLNGIFAFAIYDKNKGELFLARDAFGVKPLYYYQDENQFLFSSEIKAMVVDQSLSTSWNMEALYDYVCYLHSDQTPFKEMEKFKPGHYMQIDVRSRKVKDYRSFLSKPNVEVSTLKKSELIEQLDMLLTKAVERQLLSDVPVGFFLSGGIDSSLLVAIAKKLKPEEELQCFTIRSEYDQGYTDDTPYAKQVAEHLKVKLEVIDSKGSLLEQTDSLCHDLDEPITDPAAYHTKTLTNVAKNKGYKVLISGTGADELFSGYRRHQVLNFEKHFTRIYRPFITLLLHIYSSITLNKNKKRQIHKLLRSIKLSTKNRVLNYFRWLSDSETKNLFRSDKIGSQYLENAWGRTDNDKALLDRSLCVDQQTYLTQNNLTYTDKMGMCNGVEIRVPYLDQELAAFALQIPTHLKMKGVTTKYLLRKVAEKYLPKEIIERPKSGFGAPVRKSVREAEDLLQKLEANSAFSKIFDLQKIKSLISRNKAGKVDASYSIWALMMIESWMRQFKK